MPCPVCGTISEGVAVCPVDGFSLVAESVDVALDAEPSVDSFSFGVKLNRNGSK